MREEKKSEGSEGTKDAPRVNCVEPSTEDRTSVDVTHVMTQHPMKVHMGNGMHVHE